MAHSLKQGILARAKGISLRFSPTHRGLAARRRSIRRGAGLGSVCKEAGASHSPALRSRTKHGFEDPVGRRRWIARSGRLVWEEMRASTGLVPCCATDRANRKGIPVPPLANRRCSRVSTNVDGGRSLVPVSFESGRCPAFWLPCCWWLIVLLRDFSTLQFKQRVHGGLTISKDAT